MSQYIWFIPGGGAFDSNESWYEVGTDYPPPNPPGPGDIASITGISGGISGNGNVADLAIGFDPQLTITGTITSPVIGISGTSTVTVSGSPISNSGGTLTGSTTFAVDATSKLYVDNNGSIIGPAAGPSDQLADYGSIDINDASATTSNFRVFGAASVETSGTINATILSVGGTANATLDIGPGGVVQDATGDVGTSLGGASAATLHGAGAKWINTAFFSLAQTGAGSMVISGGASLAAEGGGVISGIPAFTVGYGGSDTLTVQDEGTMVTVTGDAGIGMGAGSGSVVLSSGATIDVSGTLDDGTSGGTGTLTITDASADVGTAVIGDSGTGTLVLNADGDLSSSSDTDIGATALNSGTVTVNEGGSLHVGGTLTIGNAGTGSLLINEGELSQSGLVVTIGAQTNANGKLTLQSATVSLTADLKVGDAGSGAVLVQDSGSLAAYTVTLGNQLGASGSFTVDGSSSAGELDSVVVGASGKGSLKVSNSGNIGITGDLTAASLVAVGVTSSVGVDTQGVLQVAGNLTIGGSAAATMTVQGAGQASGANVTLGANARGTGTLTVTGTIANGIGTLQSQLFYGGTLDIGAFGTGDLVVAKGAAVACQTTGQGTIEVASASGGIGAISLTDAGSTLAGGLLVVGGNTGTIGGIGGVTIGAGAAVTVGTADVWLNSNIVLSGGKLNTGSLATAGLISGYGGVTGGLDNTGTVLAVGGTLLLSGAVTGPGGMLDIGQTVKGKTTTGTLELKHGADTTETIGFTSGVLVVDDLADTTASIKSFGSNDTISLTGLAVDGRVFSGGTLTLTDGATTVGTLAFLGNYDTDNFNVVGQGADTEITYAGPAPCFATGTRITTRRGEVAVEHLAVGDVVAARHAGWAPIVWIGHRHVDFSRHAQARATWPVRIAAGAFGANRPCRDLFVSPEHAIATHGVLIPASALVNGSSVRQVETPEVTYWHIELAAHDVILAEKLPVESYLENGNRDDFEGGSVLALHPLFAGGGQAPCAPILRQGPLLDTVMAMLNACDPALSGAGLRRAG